MATTSLGIPYPTAGDSARNVAEDIGKMAIGIDAAIKAANDELRTTEIIPAGMASGGVQQIVRQADPIVYPLNVELLDTADMVDLTMTPTGIRAPSDGLYMVYGVTSWAADGSGGRTTSIHRNGTILAQFISPTSPHPLGWSASLTELVPANAGDLFSVGAGHSKGTVGSTVLSCHYAALFVYRISS